MATVEDDEDEWEYEYSATETQTFYVDLDLSSINGVIKSKNAGDRKSLIPNPTKGKKSNKKTSRQAATDDGDIPDQDGEEDNDGDQDGENDDAQSVNSPTATQPPIEPGLLDDDYTGRLQVLDFHTTNPIISFNGQIYSCTWHDMLGTTMFITKHQDAPFHEPEIATDDYDLIGTSRIKLVGQRARTVPKANTNANNTASNSRKRSLEEADVDEDDDDDDVIMTGARRARSGFQQYVPDGRSLGTIKRTNPKTNIEIKQQASFLEKLMAIKKARGETDSVRTFVDRITVAADAKQARQAQRVAKGKEKAKAREKLETKEQKLRREIAELNKRVVKGDNDALERLQEIYADMEEVEDDEDDEPLVVGNASATDAMNVATTVTPTVP